MAIPNTIMLDVSSSSNQLEAISAAGQDIYPGQLLEYTVDATTISRYQSASQTMGALLIAVENRQEGKGTEDIYLAGTRVYFVHMRAGDLFQVRFGTPSTAVGQGDYVAAEILTGNMIAATNANTGMAVAIGSVTTSAATDPHSLITVFAK